VSPAAGVGPLPSFSERKTRPLSVTTAPASAAAAFKGSAWACASKGQGEDQGKQAGQGRHEQGSGSGDDAIIAANAMPPAWMPDSPHSAYVLAVFGIVYLGMILGGLPRLHLDRTGVALLGAIAIVGAGVLTPEAAAQQHPPADDPAAVLVHGHLGADAAGRLLRGVTRRMAALPLRPAALLGVVIAVAAALSAVFTNDIVCLAMAPILVDACLRRRLDPVPFLLALACASNIGSAATLIGNPQNMLIGEVLKLPFGRYMRCRRCRRCWPACCCCGR
jgi:hypothetical protein